MKKSLLQTRGSFILAMVVLFVLQISVASYFCMQKQGFHYDEYYSYYSSNPTYSLIPTDMEWKDTAEIRSEFMVMPDAGIDYGTVKFMQSLDVHPPLYYYVLHTVCGMSKGIFSKWQGLFINLIFFALSWITLAKITSKLTRGNRKVILATCAIFGFSPALFSGVTFIRMYMMLTFECLLLLYVHIRSIMLEKRTFMGFYLPVSLLSFLGFHTHYYFAVFLFFVAAAVCLYLFFHKETRWTSFLYGGCVIFGMALSVLCYKACLGHIFRGYRGTEAQDAFFNLGNISERFSFFFNLTNEYCFGNMIAILLLAIILLFVTKMRMAKKAPSKWSPEKNAFMLVLVTTTGYFLVVAKTALLNAEEAIRYEMPIYGLLILLTFYLLDRLSNELGNEKTKPFLHIIFIGLVTFTLLGNFIALAQKKVCFIYPEDAKNVAWAKEHASSVVVHIYNQNVWMIWDESEELMQYDQIYFVSSDRTEVEPDEILSSADCIYVYKMRSDEADMLLEKIAEKNGGFSEITCIRNLLYCDLYELKR